MQIAEITTHLLWQVL